MVNEDGSVKTAEQIGEYVKASFITSIEHGGSWDRFLFVAGSGEGGPDICHVGNGPNGPNNALLIAAAPDLLDALWICTEHNALHYGESHNTVIAGRAAIAKATGETP
jgi:hypothetical protein